MKSRGSGDKVADRYVLEVELGRGGMGSVWKAYDQTLKRHVAIKSIVPGLELDEAARSRFEREAQAVARLKSSHIVQIFDYGVDGAPYIVMEMLEGLHLGQLLDGHRRLPLDVAARVVAQVARGLGAAHDARIVHRDLKPANVFIARMAGEDVVKVLDFGVARAFADARETGRVTAQGHVLGTPRYMSPEILRGAPADQQADVWSLGVMAYRAVTGRYPFEGEDLGDVAQAILETRPPLPSAVAADLSPVVDDFFRRALHPRPEQRFNSARELAEALCAAAGVTTSLGVADGITASVDATGPHSSPFVMEPTRTATTIDAGVLTGSIALASSEPRFGLWSSRFALVAAASTILGVGLAFAWSASRARSAPSAARGDEMPLVAPPSRVGDGTEPDLGPSSAATPDRSPPGPSPSESGAPDGGAPDGGALNAATAPATPPPAIKAPPGPPAKPAPFPKKNGDDLFNGIF